MPRFRGPASSAGLHSPVYASLVARVGNEVLPLLLTLSSGVKGYTTIHAGSARQALTRLRFICQLADTTSELPLSALNTLVSEAIDVVVHSERGPDGPRVMSVVAVEDLIAGADASQFTITEVFQRRTVRDQIATTGAVPSRLAGLFEHAGLDIGDHLGERATTVR